MYDLSAGVQQKFQYTTVLFVKGDANYRRLVGECMPQNFLSVYLLLAQLFVIMITFNILYVCMSVCLCVCVFVCI